MDTPKMSAKILGNWGEKTALAYLINNGYKHVKSGFRTRFGEIDLIVSNDNFIVFVEVKLRKNANFALARESFGKSKQSKIIKTAGMWLVYNETNLQPRFDVIEIYAPHGTKTISPEIIHLKNAF